MGEEERPTPQQQAQRIYEQAESRTAEAMEQLVRSDGFGEVLARVTQNAMALTRMSQGAWDLTLRNLRLAGREDITNLARQLTRTEDKLERVLQEIERVQTRLDALEATSASNGRSTSARGRSRASSGNGRSSRASSRGSQGSTSRAKGS
jgi:AcrR family transcriptional regulator